jgi:CarD family transcriptional regulator
MSGKGWIFAGFFVISLSSKRVPDASADGDHANCRNIGVSNCVFRGGCEASPIAAVSMGRSRLMATKALSFDVGDYVVYPKHGVGRVIDLQSTDIAGMQLELYVLRFEKEKMTLRVPTNKAESVGMRKLSSDKTMQEALATLKGKPKVKRTMWSRRAQEYEAKINSGDLVSIAEVVRDLFRPDDAPEQSYSERQIFEAASTRLARELGAMEQIDEKRALEKILDILNKAAVVHHKIPLEA